VALSHVDPELEARIPDEVNGVTLEKLSLAGGGLFEEDDADTQAFRDALRAAGASPENTTVAVGRATDNASLNIAALRVAGAQGSQFLQAVVDSIVADGAGTASQVDIAGREVVQITSMDGTVGYLIAVGDTVYRVQSPDPAAAAAALGLLPQS
jgi:hypothetical protein